MDPALSAELKAGHGIVGNANQGGYRQVTIIEQELWSDLMRRLNSTLSPSARRANLMISGFPLANSRGRCLRIGSCRIRILGETKPCERMDEALAGLKNAMVPNWSGGAYGQIMDDGCIAIGDRVSWELEDNDTAGNNLF